MLIKKKSQLSMFVVIGIILVIVSAFLIYNNKFEFFVSSDARMKNQISTIVEDCIYDSARNGVFLLGFQGGHIEIPITTSLDPNRYVDFGLKIPNWDSELGEIPEISDMENDLKVLIENESDVCIRNNLETLKEIFDIEIKGPLNVEVTMNQENIDIEAEMPISYNEKNSQDISTIENYYVGLDSTRLKDMYELALQIYTLEARSYFMEDLVLDQIYSSSDYSSADSMPSEGMYFTCGSRVWTYPQLKSNLANLNNNNFKYLYFDGTYPITQRFDSNLNGENGPEEYGDYFLKNYGFSLGNTKPSYKNYEVEVVMPSTEITGNNGILQRYPYRTFEVTPSSGQIVKPTNMEVDLGAQIPIPCIQLYHHLYSLDYDLIVKITDRSEDGDNYFFQFPLRIQVTNNQAKTNTLVSTVREEDVPTATKERYCAEDQLQYPLRVYVKDLENNYLSNVNISFKCISLSCDIGQTTIPTYLGIERIGATPYLEANFPYCVNGLLIAEKEGYNKAELRVNADPRNLETAEPPSYDVEMIPLKNYLLDKSSILLVDKDTLRGERISSEDDGTVYISIENDTYNFRTQAIWPNDGEYFNSVNLLDKQGVNYKVSLYYSDKNQNLKGMLQYDSLTPNVNLGNNIQFVVPMVSSGIDENNYAEFLDYVKLVQQSSDYGIIIS